MIVLFVDAQNKRIRREEMGKLSDHQICALVDAHQKAQHHHLGNTDHQLIVSEQMFRDYGFTFQNRRYYGNALIIKYTGRHENVDLSQEYLAQIQFVRYQKSNGHTGHARADAAFEQAARAQQAAAARAQQQANEEARAKGRHDFETQAEWYADELKSFFGGNGTYFD